MANSTAIQIIQDGPRNTIVKMVAVLDTSDLTSTTLLDPASQSSMNPSGLGAGKAVEYAIKRIDWNVSSQDIPNIVLSWDASSAVKIETLNGRGTFDFKDYPLPNNAGTGKTGKILISTQGYVSGTIEFTVTVWAIKVS